MTKKIGFIKLIRLWGVVFLIAFAGVIIGIDLVTTHHDFNIHVDNIRTDYLEQEKQATKREVERIVNMIDHERTQIEEFAKKRLKSRVFEVYSIVQNIYEQNKKLKSDAEIQKMIVDALRPNCFIHVNESCSIHSLLGENILDSTYLSSEGQNIINLQDSRGEFFVKKELELLSKKEEGFLNGYWLKQEGSAKKDFKKITFVKLFKPYNWSIGIGMYLDHMEEEIKEAWMERINNIRFGKKLVGYLFVDDWRGKSLAHGAQADLIGTDMWEYEDSRGNKTTQLLVAASKKKDGGYASFGWVKPDTGEEQTKIAFAKAIPEWELFVASGVYTDDIDQSVVALREALNAQTKRKFIIFITVVFLAFTLFFVLFHLLSDRLRKDFNMFVSFFDQAAFSDKKIDRDTVQFAELDQMAASTNKMINDRKKAVSALKESEDRFRSLSENATDMIYRMALPDGIYKYVSPASVNILGYNSQEFYKNRLLIKDIIHPDWYGYFEVEWDKLLKGEMPPTYEYQILHKDKGMRWINQRNTLEIYEDGTPRSIVGVVTDITERKTAEQELANSRAQLRILVDTIPDLIWLKDLNGVYLSCNPMFEHVFGAKEASIIGKTDYDFMDKNIADLFRKYDRQAMALDKPSVNEEWLTFADNGYYALFETIKAPMRGSGGELIGVLGIARDISKRKQAEKSLKETEKKLQEAQKMESIGTLAGGIAHEFNNMLAIIMGNNDLLIEELPQESLVGESTEEIRVAGLRARDVVKQLLTFSRQDDVVKKVMDFKAVVQESMKLIHSTTPANIEIEQNLPEGTYPVVGNATQINQLLINLCNNAFHALPEKEGKITVELLNETVDELQTRHQTTLKPGQYTKLIVSDNGIGMDNEILDRVFEPYYTTKDIGKGSGIGLAVVYGIVEQHDGTITVDSKPGLGTTFTLYFPTCEGFIEPEVDGRNSLPVGDECILHVDDEPSLAKLGKRLLDSLGYTTVSITHPEKALDLLKNDPKKFNLLITDMAMPTMTGEQLVIETLKICPNMPIIICTGYSAKISEKEAADIGVSSFIMKPINKTELAEMVRKVLDGAKNSHLEKT